MATSPFLSVLPLTFLHLLDRQILAARTLCLPRLIRHILLPLDLQKHLPTQCLRLVLKKAPPRHRDPILLLPTISLFRVKEPAAPLTLMSNKFHPCSRLWKMERMMKIRPPFSSWMALRSERRVDPYKKSLQLLAHLAFLKPRFTPD